MWKATKTKIRGRSRNRKEGKKIGDKDIHLNVVGLSPSKVNVKKTTTSLGKGGENYQLYKVSMDTSTRRNRDEKKNTRMKSPFHKRKPNSNLAFGNPEYDRIQPGTSNSLKQKRELSSGVCLNIPNGENREIRIVRDHLEDLPTSDSSNDITESSNVLGNGPIERSRKLSRKENSSKEYSYQSLSDNSRMELLSQSYSLSDDIRQSSLGSRSISSGMPNSPKRIKFSDIDAVYGIPLERLSLESESVMPYRRSSPIIYNQSGQIVNKLSSSKPSVKGMQVRPEPTTSLNLSDSAKDREHQTSEIKLQGPSIDNGSGFQCARERNGSYTYMSDVPAAKQHPIYDSQNNIGNYEEKNKPEDKGAMPDVSSHATVEGPSINIITTPTKKTPSNSVNQNSREIERSFSFLVPKVEDTGTTDQIQYRKTNQLPVLTVLGDQAQLTVNRKTLSPLPNNEGMLPINKPATERTDSKSFTEKSNTNVKNSIYERTNQYQSGGKVNNSQNEIPVSHTSFSIRNTSPKVSSGYLGLVDTKLSLSSNNKKSQDESSFADQPKIQRVSPTNNNDTLDERFDEIILTTPITSSKSQSKRSFNGSGRAEKMKSKSIPTVETIQEEGHNDDQLSADIHKAAYAKTNENIEEINEYRENIPTEYRNFVLNKDNRDKQYSTHTSIVALPQSTSQMTAFTQYRGNLEPYHHQKGPSREHVSQELVEKIPSTFYNVYAAPGRTSGVFPYGPAESKMGKNTKKCTENPKGILIFVNKKIGSGDPFSRAPIDGKSIQSDKGAVKKKDKMFYVSPNSSIGSGSTSSSTSSQSTSTDRDKKVLIETSASGLRITEKYPCGCFRIITTDPDNGLERDELVSAFCKMGTKCPIAQGITITKPSTSKRGRQTGGLASVDLGKPELNALVDLRKPDRNASSDSGKPRCCLPDIEIVVDGEVSRHAITREPAKQMKGANLTCSLNLKSKKINGVCNFYLDPRLIQYFCNAPEMFRQCCEENKKAIKDQKYDK